MVEDNLPFSISVVTYIELVQGMKNKSELRAFQHQIRDWKTEIIQLDPEISARAMFYAEEFTLSHSMMMTDALVAASAVRGSKILCTANEKHYRFIPLLELQIFEPEG